MTTSAALETSSRCDVDYLNPSLPVEARVQSLLSQMTLEEKLQQMLTEEWDTILRNNPDKAWKSLIVEHIGDKGIGCLTDSRLDPKTSAEAVNTVQRFLVEETRLGIPALIVAECLHGLLSPGATVFPQALAMSCSWNPDLLRRMAAVTALEGRAVGVVQALSPDLDLAREPRWGRCEETYGEDPYLTSKLGLAYIQGMQGTDTKIGSDKLVCTAKHFAAHGSPEAGLNLAPVQIGDRELYTTYLPPFRAAVLEGNVGSVMTAYSELDGVPSTASKKLFQEILRDQWGFDGYVFSDYGSIQMLECFHHTASTPEEAGFQALSCGVDVEAPSAWGYGKTLAKALDDGLVDISMIDLAVSRVLRTKFLSGLFENPYVDVEQAESVLASPDHRALALELARESIVLLKNDGALLPLSPTVKSIAVLGPNADQCQYGDYTCPGERGLTPLGAIRQAVSGETTVSYARGCDIGTQRRDGFAEAVELARQSDVAIVCVGDSSHYHNGQKWGKDGRDETTCGEGFDSHDIQLPGVQEEFVRAVHATGTPVVLVLAHGRPHAIEWLAQNVPVILDTWYPGEGGGEALAEILFGKVNPSGKLTMSIPRSVGQVPCYYNYKPSAKGYYRKPGAVDAPGRDYVFSGPDPLYPFGHGLSYTQFAYKNLKVTPAQIQPGDACQVEVELENTGSSFGREVAQLYVSDLVSTVTVPVRSLRSFQKIGLAPGESTKVVFDLGRADLEVLDAAFKWTVEPGDFEISVGGSKVTLTVKSAL